MIRTFKIWIARRRLERLIAKRVRSFELEQYRRRRKAALRHTPREWAA
jgi:hypothetical protein